VSGSDPTADDRSPEPPLSAGALAGLLADEDRRSVVAALQLGATDAREVRAATGLDARRAMTAIGRLVAGGLVDEAADGTLTVLAAAFGLAARAAAPDDASSEHAEEPHERAKVLRAHVRDGRLVSIPSSHAKRLVVLDLVVQDFEPGRHYTERQVNAVLARWHDDVPALRRWLVDVGYLDRDHGDYWRCGGPVDG
jgi:hypothetical protein